LKDFLLLIKIGEKIVKLKFFIKKIKQIFKMKNIFKFSVLLSMVFLISCNKSENSTETKQDEAAAFPESLTYVDKKVEKSDPNCKGKPEDCIFYSNAYIEITTDGFQFINDNIKTALVGDANDYETDANNSLKDYEEAMEDVGSSWEFSNNTTVDLNEAGLLALSFTNYSFTGGAHGNGSTSTLVVDLETKKALNFYDLFNAADSVKLIQIAEKYFRLDNELKPNEDMNEAGYFWEVEGKLSFNDNFTLTSKGLTMTYNPYEIGAYVIGSPSFTIPYSDLKPFLAEKSPLKRLLK
jgi:hypothetical protein